MDMVWLLLIAQMTPSEAIKAYTNMADQGVIIVLDENSGVEQSGSSPDSLSGGSGFKSWPRYYLWRARYVW